jgi:uncharacterized RDD family membrane protein YckC
MTNRGHRRLESNPKATTFRSSTDSTDLAGLPIRIVAALIDLVLFASVASVLLTFVYGWSYWTKSTGPLATIVALLIVVVALMPVVAALWYYWQGTPGQIALSLGVVDAETGTPISAGQGLIRAFGGILATLPIGLGLLWIAFDSKRQGWHDWLASTAVLTGVEMPMRGRDQGRVKRRDCRPLPRKSDEDAGLLLPGEGLDWTLAVDLARASGFGQFLAAVLLALAGIGALLYAGPLREVGPWAVAITAVVCLGHAASLVVGWRVSLIFGLTLFALLGVGSFGGGVWLFTRSPGMTGLDSLVVLVYGIIAWAIGVASCATGVALWHSRGRFRGDGHGIAGAAIVALVSLAVLVWAGHAFVHFYKQCQSMRTPACAGLATLEGPSPAATTASAAARLAPAPATLLPGNVISPG